MHAYSIVYHSVHIWLASHSTITLQYKMFVYSLIVNLWTDTLQLMIKLLKISICQYEILIGQHAMGSYEARSVLKSWFLSIWKLVLKEVKRHKLKPDFVDIINLWLNCWTYNASSRLQPWSRLLMCSYTASYHIIAAIHMYSQWHAKFHIAIAS